MPDARIAAQMDAIRQLIEWIADDSAGFVATVLPYGLLGLAALYVAWLVIGYLRVSQVGINAESVVQPTSACHAPGRRDRGGARDPLLPGGWPAVPARRPVLHPLRGGPGGELRELRLHHPRRGESCYRCGTRTFMATTEAATAH